MKVRMLISIGGHAEPAYNHPEFSYSPGDVVDIDKTLAAAWIAAGHAEPVKGKATPAAVVDAQQEGA